MKNIYVLSTGIFIAGIETKNIYITSDEEIKIGDYYLCKLSMKPLKCTGDEYFNNVDEKKIILTTDQDLIRDGVQAIDNEFLEWFIKNPSCEHVTILQKGTTTIIFPTPKNDIISDFIKKEESKQETLEEAAEKFAKKFGSEIDSTRYYAFINGAKWQQDNSNINALNFEIDALKKQIELLKYQQERMYSEEEVRKLIELHSDFIDSKIDYEGINNATTAISNPEWNDEEWFEQFKNK